VMLVRGDAVLRSAPGPPSLDAALRDETLNRRGPLVLGIGGYDDGSRPLGMDDDA